MIDKIIDKVFSFLECNENYDGKYKKIYDLYCTIKIISIGAPFLLFITIFVLIPNWLINKIKK